MTSVTGSTQMTIQPDIIDQLKRQFFKDANDMAKTAFDEAGIRKFRLMDTVHSFYAYLNSFLSQFESLVDQQGQKIACRRGCDTCCFQSVFMSPIEAMYLAEKLRNQLSENQFQDILKRTKAKQEKTQSMSASEYLKYRHACPLLDEETGSCIMHEFRPVACRIYLSGDLPSCIQQHKHPENPEMFAQLYDLPLQTGRAYCEGFNQYFGGKDLEVQELKFEDALLIAMENPAIIDRWIKGETIFQTDYSDEDIDAFKSYRNRPGLA